MRTAQLSVAVAIPAAANTCLPFRRLKKSFEMLLFNADVQLSRGMEEDQSAGWAWVEEPEPQPQTGEEGIAK